MKKFRVIVSIALMTVMLLSITACGGKSQTPADTGNTGTSGNVGNTAGNAGGSDDGTLLSYQKDISPFTVDWYVDLSWWKWNGQEWGNDLTSKIIKEKTGATINFLMPAADDGQQLATMIASDTLPDVITIEGWWKNKNRALTSKLASEGVIYAYNDLIEKYAPEMMDAVIRKDVFSWFAESDGKTYVLPNYAYSEQDLQPGEQLVPNGCITIRKDLWEALGSPDMTTPEGFLEACRRAKYELREYNGKQIIGIQLYDFSVENSQLWLSQYFATPYEDENGNYMYDFLQPQYKEALKFFNDAYRMGLIEDANFTDTRDLVREKIQSGRVFAQFTAPQDFRAEMQALYNTDNKAIYIPVVLRNSAGDEPVLQDIRGFGWLITAITKNAKQPGRILGLMEYLMTDEGLLDTQYGVEGVTFTWNEDRTTLTLTQDAIDDMANGSKKYALGSCMMLDNYARRRIWEARPTDELTLVTVDTWLKEPMAKYTADYNAAGGKFDPTDPRFEPMQEVATKLENARKEYIAKIIASKTEAEFERNYNEAIQVLKELGLDEFIKWKNDGFQNAKNALGQKHSWKPLLNK